MSSALVSLKIMQNNLKLFHSPFGGGMVAVWGLGQVSQLRLKNISNHDHDNTKKTIFVYENQLSDIISPS